MLYFFAGIGAKVSGEDSGGGGGENAGGAIKKTSGSWTNLQKKITPTAKFSVGKMKREEQGEDWIIEQKLKANFYLDDGKFLDEPKNKY